MAKIFDARNQPCPKPLIMAKSALGELLPGEEGILLINNQTSKENVERYLTDIGANFKVTAGSDGVYQIQLAQGQTTLSSINPQSYCSPDGKRSETVFCFKQNTMGGGPEELGKILVQACINTIKDLPQRPSALVFYNSGVLLAHNDSPLISALTKLQEMGIKILICGTCADYFKIKSEISVGQISNMYTILETLGKAGHVIYP